jgi:hypothetical protein
VGSPACAKERPDEEEKFHCLSVGNRVARECIASKKRCEEPAGLPRRGCFERDRAFCFSKLVLAPEHPGERINVCTPTLEGCEVWAGENPQVTQSSGCVDTACREVWQ